MKHLSRFILKCAGWTGYMRAPDVPKAVICVAPHTSNWDFILGKLFYWSFGKTAHFMIKREWFVFPFNLIMRPLGGIPVGQKQAGGLVAEVVTLFKQSEYLKVAITPEGTRKRNSNWKKGFYRIAAQANIPIILCYIDYGKKEIAFDRLFYPTGNEAADLREIQLFYKDIEARFPKQFAIPEK